MKPKLTVHSPYDRSVVAKLATDSAETIENKLERARQAFTAWRDRPLDARIAQVERALDVFRRDREDIAREVSRQMGKPVAEARREVDTFLDRARHMIAIAADALAPEELPPKPGFVRRIEHVPLGVVLDIVAWNYPLLLPVNVIVPALLAGNTVLLKHSDLTALTGLRFERAFDEIDVPHVVQSLIIDRGMGLHKMIRLVTIGHGWFRVSELHGERIRPPRLDRVGTGLVTPFPTFNAVCNLKLS